MIKTYSRKLEQIKSMCLSPAKIRETPKFKIIRKAKSREREEVTSPKSREKEVLSNINI